MHTTPLKTKQDVHRFFAYLLNDLELNFHPDTPFEDYINLESGQPSFTPEQQKQLNQRMDEAFKIAKGDDGDEIYQIAVEEFNKYQSQHGGLQIGVEQEEFEMGGSLDGSGKRFTANDYHKLVEDSDFYSVKDGSKHVIHAAREQEQKVGYWNRATEKLILYKPYTTENPLVKWLQENSYLSSGEIEKLAKGGHIGFKNLAKQVAAQYKGKRVATEYQHLYGKTYSAAEAQQVGEKTAAKIKRLKERKKAHFATGGKLNYHDQISRSGKSLGEEIAELAGITTDSFYFDDTDLVSEKTSKTIVPEALNNKYTKPELVKLVIEKFTKITGMPMVDLNIEIHESDAKIARHAGISLAEYDKLNHKTKKELAAKYFAQLRTFKDGGGLSGNDITYRYNHEAELPAPLHANLAKAQYGAPLYTFREAVTPDGSWYEVCTATDQVLANTLDAATATDALLHMAKGGNIFSFLQGKKRNLSRDRKFISQQEWEKNLDRKIPGKRYKEDGGEFAAGGQLSPELSMAKADLLKLQEYAEKIPALVADTDNVEPWITSAISKVEQTVAAVKHTVEAAQPEMFADGGNLQADGENLNGMLRHIGKYATALLAALAKGLQLESWMLHELAIAGSSIDEVYHKLDYKKSK